MARARNGTVIRHVQALFDAGTIGGLTDGQLLERFTTRGGEAAELAFAALVERHGPMVLRTCRAVLRDPHDAHDAFQATFLVLMRRAGTLWARDSLGAWLHQVAYRTASCARSAAARRRRHEREAAEQARPSLVHEDPDDLGEVVHEELARLPEPFRAAVVLCLVEGLTHAQAARRLGWPVGTVESRLARGRERLRARLTRRGLAPTVAAIAAAVSAGRVSAAVPAALAEATVKAAVRISTGRAAAAEVVSAGVLALEDISRTMSMAMLKWAGAVALAVGLVGTGVWANQKERIEERAVSATTPSPSAQPDTKSAPAVVARVDGTPITRDQLIEKCLEKYGAKELETLIRLEVVRQAGARRGIAVTDDDLEAEAKLIAERFQLAPDAWFRTLEDQRGWSREQYLHEIIYPKAVLKALEAVGPSRTIEGLRRQAHVEVFFDASRRAGRAAKDAPVDEQTLKERLRSIELERRLDETIKALESLRRETKR
jgi:RNA polymerase sigma factor (sigma-70 family)